MGGTCARSTVGGRPPCTLPADAVRWRLVDERRGAELRDVVLAQYLHIECRKNDSIAAVLFLNHCIELLHGIAALK